jgi:hypothetical protein
MGHQFGLLLSCKIKVLTLKTTVLALSVMLISCDSQTNDKKSSLKLLNERSLECIAIMNEAEDLKNTAIANGNIAEIGIHQKNN